MTDEFELSRRKILGAVGGVGIASAGAGMGTSALFNDTESFEGNSMTAGELDLKIDWQQQYYGPAESWEFVNAHPDHDDDGIQSLDSDEYDSVPDDGVVEYTDDGANIQEYLTCETLDHDYDFGPNQDRLVELEDVKPGDKGEITFSFHLCDNPGYIWLTGGGFDADENGVTEPEGDSDEEEDGVVELADEIVVQAWYDLDCDNVYENENGEDVIVDSPTTLREFFDNRLTANGRLLNPNVYSGGTDTTVTDDDKECNFLGKIEWGESGLSVETDDSGVDGGVVNSGTYSGGEPWRVVKVTDTVNNVTVHFLLDNFEFKDEEEGNFGEIVQFDWETLAGQEAPDGTVYQSDAEGLCRLDIKAGRDTSEHSFDLIGTGCTSGEDNVCSPNDRGISYTEFYYCPPGDSPEPDLCFPGAQTFCVGFKWWLPKEVDNEVQSDKVSFDIGFYTEQCRHNENPSGPTSS